MMRINWMRLLTKVLVASSIAVIVGVSYFVYTIDVLTEWTLTIPSNDVHAGDTVYVESKYTKLREVSGTARRYVECETRPDVFVSYAVNEVPADRRSGKGGTGVEIPIPRGIPDLPTTCRVRISIEYPVLPFRTVTEANTSNEFQLLPERESMRIMRERGNVPQSATQSKVAPAQPLSPSSVSPSSPENTTNSQASQSDTSPTTERSQSGIVQQSIDGLQQVVDNLVQVLRR